MFAVGCVAEGLQVYVGCVQQRMPRFERLLTHKPVRHNHIEQALCSGAFRNVIRIFEVDRGFRVGIGDAAAVGLACVFNNPVGRDPDAADDALVARHGRDIGVLAPAAAEIAAGRRDGIRQRAGHDMVERFLLDRVDIFCQDLLVDQRIERAADIFSHVADPAPAVFDEAAVSAEMTFHQIAVAFFVKPGFEHRRPFRWRAIASVPPLHFAAPGSVYESARPLVIRRPLNPVRALRAGQPGRQRRWRRGRMYRASKPLKTAPSDRLPARTLLYVHALLP